jgi:uncharacterized protein
VRASPRSARFTKKCEIHQEVRDSARSKTFATNTFKLVFIHIESIVTQLKAASNLPFALKYCGDTSRFFSDNSSMNYSLKYSLGMALAGVLCAAVLDTAMCTSGFAQSTSTKASSKKNTQTAKPQPKSPAKSKTTVVPNSTSPTTSTKQPVPAESNAPIPPKTNVVSATTGSATTGSGDTGSGGTGSGGTGSGGAGSGGAGNSALYDATNKASNSAFPRIPNPSRLKLALSFREEKVQLRTTTGTLFGTLTIPENSTSSSTAVTTETVNTIPVNTIPVLLLVGTNSVVNRDGTSSHYRDSSNHFKMLAQRLATQGIATLRYDTRGVGESDLAWISETYHDFERTLGDITGWMTKLRADKRFSTLTIAGCSMPNDYGREASLASAIASVRIPADGVVLIAGDSRKPLTLLRSKAALTYTPQTAREVDSLAALLEQGKRFVLKPQDGFIYDLLRPQIQSYILSLNKYDPCTEIAKVVAPVLILHGTKDWSIEEGYVQKLAAANPNARFMKVPDMSYHFKNGDDENKTLPIHRAKLPVLPMFVDIVADFVYGVRRAQ